MQKHIYLDNNASTPLDPQVIQTLQNELLNHTGNPSSVHGFGQEMKNKAAKARRAIARFLDVKPSEIVFTSGATEGINMVLKGMFPNSSKGHIITSNVEHASTFTALQVLENQGCHVDYLPAGLYGAVKPEQVLEAIRPETQLIVLLAVNNETGVKTDFEKIAQIAFERQIPFFVDGVALLGKERFKITPGISAMCFSGHKIHAPKGIGFNFIRNTLKLTPLIHGGGQESNRRGGTENILGIVGLAEAIALLDNNLDRFIVHMRRLRDKLENSILEVIPEVFINGIGPRVVNTTNLSFAKIDGESLLMNLDLSGIAVSHGSACSSGALEPSRILTNMQIPRELAKASVRFSLSRLTTEEEINSCIRIVTDQVINLRKLNENRNIF